MLFNLVRTDETFAILPQIVTLILCRKANRPQQKSIITGETIRKQRQDSSSEAGGQIKTKLWLSSTETPNKIDI